MNWYRKSLIWTVVLALVVAATPATLARPAAPAPPLSGDSAPLPQAQSANPAAEVQVYLESQGYTVLGVRYIEQDKTAQVAMPMVSGVFDESGKAQIVHGWYALAQAYPQAVTLRTVVVYKERYGIFFEVLTRDFRDWVDGKLGPNDLHYTVLIVDLQTGDIVQDKDFIRKNFTGAQPGQSPGVGTLPKLKFTNLWLIYRDDFSDELSGWEVSDTEEGSAGYANGQYRLTVKTANTVYWASAPGKIRDFALSVRASQASGDPRNVYGILFGYQDDDNVCAFFVTAEGRYAILQVAGGDFREIQPWTASDALKQGQSPNLLRVEVQGDEVRAYANGRLLTVATASNLLKGEVGVAAGSYDNPPTEVLFDDVALFAPGADWQGDPGVGGEPAHEPQAVRREAVPTGAREAQTALSKGVAASPPLDQHDLAIRLEGLPPDTPRTLDQAPQYKVGDTETFYVNKGSKLVEAQATLVYETPHARAWIEKGVHINVDAVKAATDKFENEIYVTDRSFFGSEWTPGVDNDVHVHIFNGDIPNVAGYFGSSSEYRKEVVSSSNQKEMFFMSTAGGPPEGAEYQGTLVHEFQHMIHWANKQGDDLWVDEGCAQLAEYLIGHDLPAVSIAFSRYPDRQLNAFDQGLDTRAPHYGKSFLFTVYFMGRFGREMTQQIASGQGWGTAGFDKMLAAQNLTFDDVFNDWIIANFVNDANLDPRYAYPTNVDVTRPRLDQVLTSYPVQGHSDVHQYATDYVKLEGTGTVRVDFTGSTTVPLIPVQPHSGDKVWWFGWGDMQNPRLTREFDLTNASNPQLEAWMWYDTVNNVGTKMYGFWSVSTDGGVTWKQTGEELYKRSGGGDAAEWVKHTVDLSAYAGRKVQVRFEVLTFLGQPAYGYAIDDVSLSDIGYRHDAESGDDGWVGEGFVRLMPLLPQQWTVQVIEQDGKKTTAVRQMELDASNTGSITIEGLGGEKTAVLAIAARTPYAIEWAPYEYHVTAQ